MASSDPETLHLPHLDSGMEPEPFALCSSANLMEGQSHLVRMIRRRICGFRALEVTPSVSLDDKGKVVVKGEPLITDPMWCVHLKFIPLDVPMKSFQVSLVPPETLTMASLSAAVRRGLSRGTAKMRSKTTLNELKEQLESGDSSFVSKLIFYSKRVRGSDSYWRAERAKLYTWISHHIEAGNGPPDIFMTLSCAEYFWPDMIRLLEERIWIAEGQNTVNGTRCFRDGRKIDLTNNKTDRNKAINDYALVVQQFFIKRAEDFLNTVGKQVFGIEHYWGRIEFAKGRGQIHLHLLAILNKNTTKDLQDQLNDGGKSHDDQSKLVGEWAKRVFGMTSSINGSNE